MPPRIIPTEVKEFLDDYRGNNSSKAGYSDRYLYRDLKKKENAHLPYWGALEESASFSLNDKKEYKVDLDKPSSVNSFYEMLDYGIDEDSSDFWKLSYTKSLTNLAEKAYTGKDKYDMSHYNPGFVKDILASIVSFAFPLDALSMAAGGFVGAGGKIIGTGVKVRGLSGIAREGMINYQTKKLAGKGIFSNEIVVNSLLQGVNQASTLGVFEGVRGGLEATINGENVWEGTIKGAMGGMAMGAAAGMVGGGLMGKHAQLSKIAQKKLTGGQKAGKILTSVPAQVVAEAGVFTAPTVIDQISKGAFDAEELGHAFAHNIGMFGVLKAKAHIMKEGGPVIKEYMKEIGRDAIESVANSTSAGKNASKNFNSERESNTTTEDKMFDLVGKPLTQFTKKVAKEFNKKFGRKYGEIDPEAVTEAGMKKEYDSWVKDIAAGDVTKQTQKDVVKAVDKIHTIRQMALELIKNKKKTKRPGYEAHVERLNKIVKEYEVVLDRINDNKIFKNESPALSIQSKVDISSGFKGVINRIKDKFKNKPDRARDEFNNIQSSLGKDYKLVTDRSSPNYGQVVYAKGLGPGRKKGDVAHGAMKEVYKGLKRRFPEKILSQAQKIKPKKTKDYIKETTESIESQMGEGKKPGEKIHTAATRMMTETLYGLVNKAGKWVQKGLATIDKEMSEHSYLNSSTNKLWKKNSGIVRNVIQGLYSHNVGGKLVHNMHKYAESMDRFAKWMSEKGVDITKMTEQNVKDYAIQAGSTEASHISLLLKKMQGHNLLNFSYSAGDFTVDFTSKLTAPSKEGVSTSEEGFKIDVKTGDSSIQYRPPKSDARAKGGFIEKYVTTKLARLLTKIRRSSEVGENPSHRGYLFQNTSGDAITTKVMNKIYEWAYNVPHLQGKSTAREGNRKAIGNWATAKYGLHSDKHLIIGIGILGQKSLEKIPDLVARYQTIAKDPKAIKRLSKELVKEFLEDVKNGSFTSHNGTVYDKNNKYTKAKGVFDIWQVKKALKDLEKFKAGEHIEIDGQTYTKNMVKAIVEYGIQTGPRLNELAPTTTQLTRQEAKLGGEFQLSAMAKDAKISVRDLRLQIAHIKKKLPHIVIKLEKNLGKYNGQYVLGKIHDHIVKVSEKRATITTAPHEAYHHIINVLEAFGDKFSRRLIQDGIELHRGKGVKKKDLIPGTKAYKDAREAFVEHLAKYGAKEIKQKSVGRRIGAWFTNAMTHLSYMFGLASRKNVREYKKDIQMMIGEKLMTGKIPTEAKQMALETKIEYQTYKEAIKNNSRTVGNVNRNIHKIFDGLTYLHGYSEKELRSKAVEYIGFEYSSFNLQKYGHKIDIGDLGRYSKYLERIAETKNINPNWSNKKAKAESQIAKIEAQYNIPESTRNDFLKAYGVKKIENASETLIKAYKYFVRKHFDRVESKKIGADNVVFLSDIKMKHLPGHGFHRAMLGPAQFLIEYGGKPGRIIGQKLYNYDWVKHQYQGLGETNVEKIGQLLTRGEKRLKGLKGVKDYMILMDGGIGYKYKNYYKKLAKKGDAHAIKELKKIEFIQKQFKKKGSELNKVRELWRATADGYWESLQKEIMRANVNSTEARQMVKALKETYVSNYFSRKITMKAMQILTKDGKHITKLVENQMADAAAGKAKSLNIRKGTERYADLLHGRSKEGKELMNEVRQAVWDMITYGHAKVNPGFLKKRGLALDPFIKDPETGKMIKTYESGVEGTMEYYVKGMSKLLATVREFPEFTKFAGKYTLGGRTKLEMLEASTKDESLGAYAKLTIERELGLDSSMSNALTSPIQKTISKITSYSAAIGLSSPTAGLKNVLIQLPRSAAIYGMSNTWNAMQYAGFGALTKKGKGYNESLRKGHLGYGTKTLDLGREKIEIFGKEYEPIKFMFEKVNQMQNTENLNRIVTSQAGKAYFTQMLQAFRGDNTGFLAGMFSGKRAQQAELMFETTWKLSKKEIEFLRKEPDLKVKKSDYVKGENPLEQIMLKVEHFSHATSAGSTSTSMLPLWMSHKYTRPLTLFQRMATSVTIDSYNNYIKPIKSHGNALPLLKATIGHYIAGAALYGFYDAMFGVESPESEGSEFDKAIMYLWRGEFLGMFGELISPYEKGLAFPVMEPVIVRNTKEAGKQIWSMMGQGKQFKDAVYDWSKKSIVAVGQADKLITNIRNPNVKLYKKMKTLETQFRQFKGATYKKSNVVSTSERTPYYNDLRNAIYFSDEDGIAQAYYKAYNYLVTLQERDGITSVKARKKYAERALKSVVKHMQPTSLSIDSGGRMISKKDEFRLFLSKENRELLKKLDRHFGYQLRKLDSIKRNISYQNKYSVYPI